MPSPTPAGLCQPLILQLIQSLLPLRPHLLHDRQKIIEAQKEEKDPKEEAPCPPKEEAHRRFFEPTGQRPSAEGKHHEQGHNDVEDELTPRGALPQDGPRKPHHKCHPSYLALHSRTLVVSRRKCNPSAKDPASKPLYSVNSGETSPAFFGATISHFSTKPRLEMGTRSRPIFSWSASTLLSLIVFFE